MKYVYFSLLALLQLVLVSVIAQTCEEEFQVGGSTGPSLPTSGANLEYCRDNSEQCCTNVYFKNKRMEIIEMLMSDLKEGINDQINRLGDVVDGLLENFRQRFIPRFSRNFCSRLLTSPQCNAAIEDGKIGLLHRMLIRDDELHDPSGENIGFSPAGIISTFFNHTLEAILNDFVESRVQADLTSANKKCIREALKMIVPADRERYVYDNLTIIRRAATSLSRLRNEINRTVIPMILDVRPTNSCIESFINIRCEACMPGHSIPENCRGACNALVYGCLAPFRDGLERQFNLLWNVTSQLVNITNRAMLTAGRLPQQAFSINISNSIAVTQLLKRTCSLTFTNPSASNNNNSPSSSGGDNDYTDDQDDFELPESVRRNSSRLLDTGAFSGDGLRSCSEFSNVNCWNGTANVTVNNVNFDSRSIAGQVDNPLASYNVSQLERFSETFGFPVTDYLRSGHFLDVIPEGLALPFNTTTNNGTGNEPDAAGISLSYSVLVFLTALIAGSLLL